MKMRKMKRPDIGMGSFMSERSHFNRETSGLTSMTKALSTLKSLPVPSYSEMKRFRRPCWCSCTAPGQEGGKVVQGAQLCGPPAWRRQQSNGRPSPSTTPERREARPVLEERWRVAGPGPGAGRPALNEPIKTAVAAVRQAAEWTATLSDVCGFSNAQASLRANAGGAGGLSQRGDSGQARDGFAVRHLPRRGRAAPDFVRRAASSGSSEHAARCHAGSYVNYMIGTPPFGGSWRPAALASLLEAFFRLRLPSELPPELPQFNCQRLRGSVGRSFGGLKEIERRRHASAEGRWSWTGSGPAPRAASLLCGPGPQACDANGWFRRACMDRLMECADADRGGAAAAALEPATGGADSARLRAQRPSAAPRPAD
uniref:Collagen alpha-1(I) chain-like n=1 Tax=Macrostomum lignano TaxID=282301 RepID=A0A1I8FGP8_9PLAT